MAKCIACGKFLSSREGAGCSNCKQKYHLACAQLPQSSKVGNDWRCHICRNKTTITPPTVDKPSSDDSTGGFSSTSFQDAAEADEPCKTQVDMVREMRLLRAEVRQMRDELAGEIRECRHEMAEIRNALSTCNKRVDDFERRLQALEDGSAFTASEGATSQLEHTVAQLKLDLNDRDQELLSSDLEIANLPENPGENVLHTIELVAKKLGVDLESRDIVFAERVGARVGGPADGNLGGAAEGGARTRRIVVRLARRGLRDDLLRAARVRRTTTSADLGFAAPAHRFYLNERLTRYNKQLFYRSRQAALRASWKYTWTKRGKILTKQGDGKQTYSIRSEVDLERVFGRDVVEICNN